MVKEPTYAYETHGRDGFGEIGRRFDQTFGAPKAMAWPGSLLDFYQAQTKKQSNIVLICLGTLTNLAHLLQEDQTMVASFDRIISMGGSYKSHGNASPVAEFNYWYDPEAAAYVYENAPRPIEMVGLDVTRPILLNAERLDKWKAAFGKIGDFIEALTAFYSAFHKRYEGIEGCVINDPLAVACLLDDQLLQGFSSYVDIESHGKARGASIVDAYDFYRRQPNALVYTEVNPDRFFELYQSLVEAWT